MKRPVSLVLLALLSLSFASSWVTAQQSGSAGREVKEVDGRIRQAIRLRSVSVLEANIAGELLLTDSSGMTLNKAQFINRIKTSDGEEVPTEIDDVHVRVYGGVAVLTCRISVVDSTIIGDFSGQWRETSVYVKRQRHWQLVSSQETLIRRR